MAEAVMAMKHSATSVQKDGKNGNGNKQPRYMQNIQVQNLREIARLFLNFFFFFQIVRSGNKTRNIQDIQVENYVKMHVIFFKL